MDRDLEANGTIDYDLYRARAHALREQEIDRLFGRLGAWLRSLFGARPVAASPLRSGNSARREPPKLTLRGARDARC